MGRDRGMNASQQSKKGRSRCCCKKESGIRQPSVIDVEAGKGDERKDSWQGEIDGPQTGHGGRRAETTQPLLGVVSGVRGSPRGDTHKPHCHAASMKSKSTGLR